MTAVEIIAFPFANCPRGHELLPRHMTISWYPCDCAIAEEVAAVHGGAPGHHTVGCEDCHAERWQTIRHQPPHVNGHHPSHSSYPAPLNR